MSDSRITAVLAPVRRRWRRRRTLALLAFGWGTAAAIAVAVAFAGYAFEPVAALSMVLVITAAAFAAARMARPDDLQLARLVEAQFSDLAARLLTAVELPTGARGPFERQLIAEVITHAAEHDWRGSIRLTAVSWQAIACGALFASGLLVPATAEIRAASQPAGRQDENHAGIVSLIDIAPGTVEIERGGDLLVTARFAGPVPVRPLLIVDRSHAPSGTDAPGTMEQLALVRNLEDPLFGARIERIERDLRYRVEGEGIASEEFRVTVFDYPRLERADATVLFPSWTNRPEETLADSRRVSVVEGSQVVWTMHFNKPLASAALEVEDGERIEVELLNGGGRSDQAAAVGRVLLAPQADRAYHLRLTDDAGRTNREPPEFSVRIQPNRAPELKLTFPGRDVRVSPIEELVIEGTAWDDFGLARFGLIYEVPGSGPRTLILGEATAPRAELAFSRTIPLEDLGLRPGQLVAYHLFAEDIGPDSRTRRTLGDIFLAEVRPFEQIYREGQPPPGGGGGEGSGGQNAPVEQLAALQKQIVIATWTLRRDRSSRADDHGLRDDAGSIAESQQVAIERFAEVRTKLPEGDLRQRRLAEEVAENMSAALDRLRAVADARNVPPPGRDMDEPPTPPIPTPAVRPDADPLFEAVAAAQSALEGLLRLQPREHQVVKGEAGGGSAGSANRSNQQLDQLELTAGDNRYQAERTSSRAAQERDERLQVLNRLRELAHRQAEINAALRESEQELLAARAPDEIEEARRRLKRLRDEQQKLLEDVDRLRERMENQRESADAREQIERARSQVRRTSKALEAGRTSQAIAEGARAERAMRRLGDDLRQRVAGEFADAIRQLREQSRRLEREQERLADELRGAGENPRQALRAARDRERLERALREQGKRFEQTVGDVEKLMQQAEPSEPLLARTLHEALRNADSAQPRENLERAAIELASGHRDDAQQAEAQARAGIAALRQGIETAAADVLGSELEDLRRARREVDKLTEAVRREMAGMGDQSAPQEAGPQLEGDAEVRPASAEKGAEPSARPSGDGGSPQNRSQASADRSPPSAPAAGDRPDRVALRRRAELRPDRSAKSSRGRSESAGLSQGEAQSGGGGIESPLTGSSQDFERWSDGLRAVEELVADQKTRDEVRRIRERAQQVRIEQRRHSREPDWKLVRAEILEPLAEVRERIAEEIARHDEGGALVPLDRDPVPDRYSELVRRYYEKLGGGH